MSTEMILLLPFQVGCPLYLFVARLFNTMLNRSDESRLRRVLILENKRSVFHY